jgi:hypothetical protein
MDDAFNKRGARQLNYKDFTIMTRCCSIKTTSCTHAKEEENVRYLLVLRAASLA